MLRNSPHRRRPRASVGRAPWGLAALAAALLGGCAAPGSDVHVAPLLTRTTGSDRIVRTEGLGGMLVWERDLGAEAPHARALRPLYGWRDQERHSELVSERTDFLVPFGYRERAGEDITSILFPLYYWRSGPGSEEGGRREFDLVALPGILWSENERGARKRAWFPFYGDLDKFLTFDNVRFLFFPLYARTERRPTGLEDIGPYAELDPELREEVSVGHNVLWPVFGWSVGGPTQAVRFWPLFGYNVRPGRHQRWFVLWPIGHVHRNRLAHGPEGQELKWMVWPLLGHTRVGTYRSWTTLWPFFGYAYDRESGFWAWDGPWFLVRLQGGGRAPLAEERTRLWPFYSHFKGDGLEAQKYAWPLVHVRKEDVPGFRRASFYALPFWHQWDLERTDTGRREAYRKYWPFYQAHHVGEHSRRAVLALNPFVRLPILEYHYGWLWELWVLEREGDRRTQRSWLGVYQRESDGDERRAAFSGLWARRSFGPEGARTRETSLLFGLLRWRSGPEESDPGILRPAFPGPGWPARWEADRPPARSNAQGE